MNRYRPRAEAVWRLPPQDAPPALAAEICVAEIEGDYTRLNWLLAEQADERRRAA